MLLSVLHGQRVALSFKPAGSRQDSSARLMRDQPCKDLPPEPWVLGWPEMMRDWLDGRAPICRFTKDARRWVRRSLPVSLSFFTFIF